MDTPTWEPGDLTSNQLRTVLTDALADIYSDCYRRDQSEVQHMRVFSERITRYIQDATGLAVSVRP